MHHNEDKGRKIAKKKLPIRLSGQPEVGVD